MDTSGLKHLCWYCAHECSGRTICALVEKTGQGVKHCTEFVLSFGADLELDALGAIERLVRAGRLESGLVIRFPGKVITTTVPEISSLEIITEMRNQAEIRRKNDA